MVEAGRPVDAPTDSIASDSLAPRRVGEMVFPIVRAFVDRVLLVTDEEIRREVADFRMTYLNSDGSRADLCGNATLCSVRLAVELGIMPAGECHVETDAGVLSARLLPTGPEIDLGAVREVRVAVPATP